MFLVVCVVIVAPSTTTCTCIIVPVTAAPGAGETMRMCAGDAGRPARSVVLTLVSVVAGDVEIVYVDPPSEPQAASSMATARRTSRGRVDGVMALPRVRPQG